MGEYWQETAAWPRRDGGRVLPQLRDDGTSDEEG